jgi:hypothetical protein
VARRLGCDAELVAITERDGLPIDVGRRRRLFTGRQRQALQARDRTCCYPGCTVPVRRTQCHHIEDWLKGGKTNLANGANLCNLCRRRDNRHTFAVNTLLGWYRDGLDVPSRMHLLSTYLGHLDPSSTYWYLSATPELLGLAGGRLERTLGELP